MHVNKATLPYLFVFVLSVIGGFADAASFVSFGVFSGHLTGNSVLSLVYFVNQNTAALYTSLISLLGFASGTVLGIVWRKRIVQHKFLCLPIIMQFALLSGLFMAKGIGPDGLVITYVFIAGLSFSLGLQNGVFTQVAKVNVHTTYITGTATTFIESLFKASKVNEAQVSPRFMQGILLLGFVLGAGLGALMTYCFALNGFMLILLLIALSGILCYLNSQNTSAS